MKRFVGLIAVFAFASTTASAQGRGEGREEHRPPPRPPEVGGGHIPQRGPERAPEPQKDRRQEAQRDRRPEPPRYDHIQGHPNAPHVDVRTNLWFGHDTRREEIGLRLEHPWAHGRFDGMLGPSHVYRLHGGSARRFGFDRYWFTVATIDAPFVGNWFWDSDDIVLYDDPDHPGFYLAYNVRLGTYAHVEMIGP